MRIIRIKKDGEKWSAYHGDKRIGGSACKSCIINVMIQITKKSTKYDSIVIHNEDGTPNRTIQLGVY